MRLKLTQPLAGGLAGAVLIFMAWSLLGPSLDRAASAGDVNCSHFANQAAAQSFFLNHGGPGSDPDNLDEDGDGMACESLPCPCAGVTQPGGGGKKPGSGHCRRPRHAIRVTFSKSDYPNIIRHIKYSWRIGYPKKLVIWRKGADRRRDLLLEGIPTKPGYDRDEAPAAVLRKKIKADVRYVPSGENRSAGSSLGRQISGFCSGVRVLYRFTP